MMDIGLRLSSLFLLQSPLSAPASTPDVATTRSSSYIRDTLSSPAPSPESGAPWLWSRES